MYNLHERADEAGVSSPRRSRLTTTKASQVKQITVADEVLWNSPAPIGG